MNTDDILRSALYAAAAVDPVGGEHLKKFADEKIHRHEWKQVPNRERTDRLIFVCAQYKCACGETRFM